jgi:hypothetical protein
MPESTTGFIYDEFIAKSEIVLSYQSKVSLIINYMATTSKRKMSTGKKVAIGAGIALAAGAAAYLLTGKRGEKNRKALKELSAKAKQGALGVARRAGEAAKEKLKKIVK